MSVGRHECKQHLGVMIYDPVLTTLWTIKCLDRNPPLVFSLLVSSRFVPSDIPCVSPFVCLPNDHPAVPPSLSSRFILSSCAYFSSFLIGFSLVGLCLAVGHRCIKSSTPLSRMVITPFKVFFVCFFGWGEGGQE